MRKTKTTPNRREILENVARLISEDRNATHGEPILQFWMAQTIKGVLREGPRWTSLLDVEKEALEMLSTKLSRIVCGSSNPDHYNDIAGYVGIASEGVQRTDPPSKVVFERIERTNRKPVKKGKR